MPTKKPLAVSIICQDGELFKWLELTLTLGNLKTKYVNYYHPIDVNQVLAKANFPDLIITTDTEFKNLIRKCKSQLLTHLPCPILVLTDSFQTINKPKHMAVTFDTLPVPIITINLLEHAVKSLLNDFALTSKLTKLAHYDPLTGAANRLLFEDRLNESIKRIKRYKESISLLYFDLDEFKPVNDTYGHDAGDELLKSFVRLINDNIRDIDTIARMGGDEFALILTNTDRPSAERIAEKVIYALTNSSTGNNYGIEIKSSIGAVTADSCTRDKLTSTLLLKKADEAVYRAKQISGTSIVFDTSLTLC